MNEFVASVLRRSAEAPYLEVGKTSPAAEPCPTAECLNPRCAPHLCPLSGGTCACCGACARACQTLFRPEGPVRPAPWRYDPCGGCGEDCASCGDAPKAGGGCSGGT